VNATSKKETLENCIVLVHAAENMRGR